jgi:hypothetical protein
LERESSLPWKEGQEKSREKSWEPPINQIPATRLTGGLQHLKINFVSIVLAQPENEKNGRSPLMTVRPWHDNQFAGLVHRQEGGVDVAIVRGCRDPEAVGDDLVRTIEANIVVLDPEVLIHRWIIIKKAIGLEPQIAPRLAFLQPHCLWHQKPKASSQRKHESARRENSQSLSTVHGLESLAKIFCSFQSPGKFFS